MVENGNGKSGLNLLCLQGRKGEKKNGVESTRNKSHFLSF